jgi:hypothetical protein
MHDPSVLVTVLLRVPVDALAGGRISGWVSCPATGEEASIGNADELMHFLADQSQAPRGDGT